ncbi:hypothetical protein QBC39DRAFT_181372 [Podospora conica]|nr:hypothetical protein QBC39DRAFT_181372 [Schizothecium conicum]
MLYRAPPGKRRCRCPPWQPLVVLISWLVVVAEPAAPVWAMAFRGRHGRCTALPPRAERHHKSQQCVSWFSTRVLGSTRDRHEGACRPNPDFVRYINRPTISSGPWFPAAVPSRLQDCSLPVLYLSEYALSAPQEPKTWLQ